LFNGKGIPAGRVTEFFGPEHIGKSTLLDQVFARVQTMGGVAILAEPEGGREIGYTRRLGVDVTKLQYLHFSREEFHLENVLTAFYRTIDWWRINSPETPVVLGLDALAGTATREELAEGLGKNKKPGAAAKVMREASRQLPARLGNTNIAVIICNHEYEKIQTFGFGKKRETYGGGGLRHLASLRVSLYRTGKWVKAADGSLLGQIVGARLVKNRLGSPWGSVEFALMPGTGVNNVWTLYEALKSAGLVRVAGGWAALNLEGDIIKFQGWLGLQKLCAERPDLFDALTKVYWGLGDGQ